MKNQITITAGVNLVQYLHLFDVSDAVMHSNQNFGLILGEKKTREKQKGIFFFILQFLPSLDS